MTCHDSEGAIHSPTLGLTVPHCLGAAVAALAPPVRRLRGGRPAVAPKGSRVRVGQPLSALETMEKNESVYLKAVRFALVA